LRHGGSSVLKPGANHARPTLSLRARTSAQRLAQYGRLRLGESGSEIPRRHQSSGRTFDRIHKVAKVSSDTYHR
jgi:hypothetical protein